MKETKLTKLVLVLLKVIFVVGSVMLITLPYIYNFLFERMALSFSELLITYKLAVYICAIITLFIILKLINIFNIIAKNNPFDEKIALNIKEISISFLVFFIVITIKTCFFPTVISAAIIVITFIAGLSFYVLSKVYETAVEYKKESDYTV